MNDRAYAKQQKQRHINPKTACWALVIEKKQGNCVNQSDEQLMLCYQKGDAAAFQTLYERHKDGLYRFFQRALSDTAGAEELYQEVWLSVIKARERYQVQAKFTTYLYHIAHNRLVDTYRKQNTAPSFDSIDKDSHELTDQQSSLEDSLISEQAVQVLLKAVYALPIEQKQVFLLKQEAKLTLAEIAHITGENTETVKSRLRYAMAKLRQQLDQHTTHTTVNT